MPTRKFRIVITLATVWLAAPFAPPAIAQNYPQRPVRMILPYLGSTEFAGRWLAAKLSPPLGQQVVVDPRPGAGGRIGHDLLSWWTSRALHRAN